MIIHDLNVIRVCFSPNKAETPLIVDPDAVLSSSIAVQQFQPISRRSSQVPQLHGAIQLPELSTGNLLDSAKAANRLPTVKTFGLRTAERPDHQLIVSC
jgi:hypothetical protein